MKKLLLFLLLLSALPAFAQTDQTSQFRRTFPKSLDFYSGKFVGGAWVPYASVSEANAAIPVSRRYNGFTVTIGTPTNYKEYWYYGGLDSTKLVLKPAGSGGTAVKVAPYTIPVGKFDSSLVSSNIHQDSVGRVTINNQDSLPVIHIDGVNLELQNLVLERLGSDQYLYFYDGLAQFGGGPFEGHSAIVSVRGELDYADGNQADGKYLRSDANGKATWTDLPTAATPTLQQVTDANDTTTTGIAITGGAPLIYTQRGEELGTSAILKNTLGTGEVFWALPDPEYSNLQAVTERGNTTNQGLIAAHGNTYGGVNTVAADLNMAYLDHSATSHPYTKISATLDEGVMQTGGYTSLRTGDGYVAFATAPTAGTGSYVYLRTDSLSSGAARNVQWQNSDGTVAYTAQVRAKQDLLTILTGGSSGPSNWNATTSTLNIPTYTLSGLGGIGLTALSATAPLGYNNTTGTFSVATADGSTTGVLSSAGFNRFDSAANKKIVSAAFSGSASKTLTLTRQDGSTLTASFTDSTGGAGGITALTGEVTASGPGSVAATVSNSAVIGKVLTGYTSGSGTVAGTDNILQAIQKLNGNDALKAPLASPTFTGAPALPTGTTAVTQTAGNNSTAIATTAYTDAAVNLKANLASPTFTGTPAAPTATAGTNTTQLATTAFVTTADNLKANLASPTFTGSPVLPTGTSAVTQTAGNSTTALATTAFVTTADNLKANLASPTFTGTPLAPTATAGTNTTQIATTAFVLANAAPIASPAFTGAPTAPTASTGTNTTQLATTAFVLANAASSVGVTNGGNAATGNIGEFAEGAATNFTTTPLSPFTDYTLDSITLTAGDWIVNAKAIINVGNPTTIAKTNTLVLALDAGGGFYGTLENSRVYFPGAAVSGANISPVVFSTRVNISSTTKIFVRVLGFNYSGTASVDIFPYMSARRVR